VTLWICLIFECTMTTLYLIVEGGSDAEAVPSLLSRLRQQIAPQSSLICLTPDVLKRTQLRSRGTLERRLLIGANKLAQKPGPSRILILMDADDDCPVELATYVRGVASGIGHLQVPVSAVFANREFESWFLAAELSAQHNARLRPSPQLHPDPDTKRGAKEYFALHHLLDGQFYAETIDQRLFAGCIDVELALKKSRSFRKLRDEVVRILA
jgi:hypothetical protein